MLIEIVHIDTDTEVGVGGVRGILSWLVLGGVGARGRGVSAIYCPIWWVVFVASWVVLIFIVFLFW